MSSLGTLSHMSYTYMSEINNGTAVLILTFISLSRVSFLSMHLYFRSDRIRPTAGLCGAVYYARRNDLVLQSDHIDGFQSTS